MDYRRTRKTEHAPLLTQEACGHQVSGYPHQFQPDLVSEHFPSGEEGSTEAFLPKEAETGWTFLSAAHKSLQSHNREHPLSQCINVVWGCNTGQEEPPTGGENGSVDCRKYTPS